MATNLTPKWAEDVDARVAVKTKPSTPNPSDEYKATDQNLWQRVLEVASGKRQDYTKGGRTINSPNDGRGYRNMPHNPNGIAWAVKQYKGFGGIWRSQKEAAQAQECVVCDQVRSKEGIEGTPIICSECLKLVICRCWPQGAF